MKELGKEIGNKIDFENIGEHDMNIQEIHQVVAKSGLMRAGSWAFRNAVQIVKDKVYRFTVSGHHHKGHVYIVLGWMDTFKIYYTSNQGTIKKIETDVYIDVLIDTLDISIERIAEYTH